VSEANNIAKRYMKIGIQIVAPFDVLDGPADYRVIFRAVPTIV
jgi:hypothetical protein